MPDVERVLKKQGVKVPRPQYDGKATASEEVDDPESAEEEAEGEEEKGKGSETAASKSKGKLDRFKRNHEATSDEDDD